MDTLISIIVPVYNVEKYLPKCLESIINQTYKNLQIIVVIDGSKDNSEEVAREYAKRDQRIEVVVKENGGLSSARNEGLKYVKGQYLLFVDSDDYIDVKTVEICYEKMISSDADLVAFSKYNVYEGEGKITEFILPKNTYNITTDEERLEFITKKYGLYKIGFEAWNKLFKMSIIEENNIRFENNYQVFAEDICFGLYYLSFVNKAEVLDLPLYYYIIRDDSIMGQAKADMKLPNIVELTRRVKGFYQAHNKNYLVDKFDYVYSVVLHNRFREFKFYDMDDEIRKVFDSPQREFFEETNSSILANKKSIISYFNYSSEAFDEYYLGDKIVEEILLAKKSKSKFGYFLSSRIVYLKRAFRKITFSK